MLLNQKAALHSSGAFHPSDAFKVISLRVVRWRNCITTEYKYDCFDIPRVPDGFVGFEVVWNFTSEASFESGNHVKGTIKEVMMQSHKHNLRMWAQVDIWHIISLAADPAPLSKKTHVAGSNVPGRTALMPDAVCSVWSRFQSTDKLESHSQSHYSSPHAIPMMSE